MKAGGVILIAALAAVLYLNTLSGPYLYDDVSEIQSNYRVHRLSAIPSLLTTEFWYGVRGRGILYRPVTAATIPPTFLLAGGSAWPFHAANILLHALAACLLAAVVERLTGRPVAAWIAGVLFAILPIHTEAVAWISGRSELLFVASGAAAWWFHLRARDGGRPWHGAAAAALLAVSLGSKETAICWPILFAVGDLLFPSPGRGHEDAPARAADVSGPLSARRSLRPSQYLVYAVVALAWVGSRYLVLGQLGRRPEEGAHFLNPLESEPWWPARPFTALKLLALALLKTVSPSGSCIDYGYDQIPVERGPLHFQVIAGAAVLGGLAVWVWRSRRRLVRSPRGVLALAAASFLVSWFPVSSLLLASVSIFAERNMYLPSFGACLAAGVAGEWLWHRAGARARSLAAAGVAVAAVLSASVLSRNAAFKDPITLFASSAADCPRSARVHFLLAAALEDAGRLGEAVSACRRALEIAPDYVDARADMARGLALLGRKEEAAREARAALASRPRSIETRLDLAAALATTGERASAAQVLEDLRRDSPEDPRVRFMQAQILREQGRPDEAMALFQSLRDGFPENPAGHDGMGTVHMSRGNLSAAREEFEKALGLDPYDTSALYNMGLLALQTEPPTEMLARESSELFGRYLKLARRDALAWIRLGQAQERLGRIPEAEDAFRQAVTVAPGHPRPQRELAEFLERQKKGGGSPAPPGPRGGG